MIWVIKKGFLERILIGHRNYSDSDEKSEIYV